MSANDNAPPECPPRGLHALLIGRALATRLAVPPGFDLKRAAAALRPKPMLRLVGHGRANH